METYRMIVEYDGTRYGGFKKSKQSSAASIQEKIEAVLVRLIGDHDFILNAAVNTEPGVHSMGQTVSLRTNKGYTEAMLKEYLNQYLPKDIVVREVEKRKESFHAELGKKGLCYEYRIQNGPYRNVMEQAYMEYEPGKLDIPAMEEGMQLLLGSHDLMSYNHNRKLKKSTLRTIDTLKLKVDQEEIRLICVIDDVWPGLMPAIFSSILKLGRHILTPAELQEQLEKRQLGILYTPASTKGITLKKCFFGSLEDTFLKE